MKTDLERIDELERELKLLRETRVKPPVSLGLASLVNLLIAFLYALTKVFDRVDPRFRR